MNADAALLALDCPFDDVPLGDALVAAWVTNPARKLCPANWRGSNPARSTDIGDLQGNQLGASERARPAEQDQRLVSPATCLGTCRYTRGVATS